ncbi:hypothetical protein NX059_004620 [Plenodomus lindquistii]|nr:hypothetical protein NX059_004620 [Plenodomus lindquistii]
MMQPRISAFAKSFQSTAALRNGIRPTIGPRVAQFVCRSCRKKFSTSPKLHVSGQASEIAKPGEKAQKYKSRLLIYDAGDTRTTWISFWKAMALLQFGTTLVFGVPPLWNNENQPDPRVRKLQAVLVGILGTIPTLTLAYVTAPFVHQVFLQIPEYARRSRKDLSHFASTLRSNPRNTANTKLEFVTLRIFPFRKHTTAFIHELRALPPARFRLANIELPKSAGWAKRQRAKGIMKRMWEVVNEPRFKFFVKEGRFFTTKTGVPGVWEEVAARIQEQTIEAQEAQQAKTGSKRPLIARKAPVRLAKPVTRAPVKRQTSRPLPK